MAATKTDKHHVSAEEPKEDADEKDADENDPI